MDNYITVDYLNLRKEPVVSKENILAIMPPDTVVEKLTADSDNKWFRINAVLGNTILEGYAFANYLLSTQKTLPVLVQPSIKIPEVHLTPKEGMVISKRNTSGRAYPLNEASLVRINLAGLFDTVAANAAFHQVLDYLDVENSERYAPSSSNTFCNIYAFDVSYCMGKGVYIPRVWWREQSLTKILSGETEEVIYEKTVTELNANSITNWFENYGHHFGWKRVFDLTQMQEKVNSGTLGIIVGQRINLNNPGHIVAVVPEKSGLIASRQDGKVISPLQSQAGSKNKKYFTGNNWWENANRFKKFGFWVWQKE